MLREEKIKFARRAAADGMVLLKNNNALPIEMYEEIALFGVASYKCFRMGWGSGDMLAQNTVQISDALKNAGYELNAGINKIYEEWLQTRESEYSHLNRNWGKWTFRFNEPPIDEELIKAASEKTDVAVVTIGRCSGEADDLKNEEGYYKFHIDESLLIEKISKYFKKTILLLNVCGPLDLSSIDSFKVDAIVYVSFGGEQFGNAVADIISAKIIPSGKLTTTWAYKYEDYPTCDGIGTLNVPYSEGIYVGYRYFDSFGIVPRYPFGYGLSYTDFKSEIIDIRVDGQVVDIAVKVTNVGNYEGREIIQCYISAPKKRLEKAYQELCAYAKTDTLIPNNSCEVLLSFDMTDMASYFEDSASYILESGEYVLRVGNSSRNTHVACRIRLCKDVVCAIAKNRMICKEQIEILSNAHAEPYTYEREFEEITNSPIFDFDCESVEQTIYTIAENDSPQLLKRKDFNNIYTLDDVAANTVTVEDVVAQFDNEELACILNGVIYIGSDANANVGSMSSKVHGAAGEMWSSEKYAIPVNACADGPSGIRLSVFGTDEKDDTEIAHNVVAYPSATCFANSWDLETAYNFGECIRSDLEYADIEGWLAPGVNIHRNPLNGRNFEYFSEDPLISGKMAAYITIGVQYDENAEPTGRYTTVKHFACNNIEYERGLSDSRISERALREIYLKAFKIAVDEGNPHAVMTSYNKINGEFASTNYDLLNGILRGEWKYDGIVMTDWNPFSDPKKHSSAGNDLIMPGCHRKDILEGLSDNSVSKSDAQLCAVRLLKFIMKTNFVIKKRETSV